MGMIEVKKTFSRRELLWFGPLFALYLFPSLQRPLYRGWMFSVMPIGWIVSHLLLSVIYYLLLTPIGLIMKAVGYDPMRRKLEPNQETYWVNRQKSEDPQRYFKQY